MRVELPIVVDGDVKFSASASEQPVALLKTVAADVAEVALEQAPGVLVYLPINGGRRTVRMWNGDFYEKAASADRAELPDGATGTSFMPRRLGYAGSPRRRGKCLTEAELVRRRGEFFADGNSERAVRKLLAEDGAVIAIAGEAWIRVEEPVLKVAHFDKPVATEMALRGFSGRSGVVVEMALLSTNPEDSGGVCHVLPEHVFNLNDWREAADHAREYAEIMTCGPAQHSVEARSFKILEPSAFRFDRAGAMLRAETRECASHHIEKFLKEHARTVPTKDFEAWLALRDAYLAAMCDPKDPDLERSIFDVGMGEALTVAQRLQAFLIQEMAADRLSRLEANGAAETLLKWAARKPVAPPLAPSAGVSGDISLKVV